MTVSESIHNLLLKKNDLIDTVTEQQDCVNSLKTNFTVLNIKYQLLKKCQWADHEETQLSNTFTSSVDEGKHSLKISDSSFLNNSTESTWEDWINKMHVKLTVNDDHYLTEIAQMRYVMS